MGSIPLVDLAAQHAEIAAEVASGWQEILDRAGFAALRRDHPRPATARRIGRARGDVAQLEVIR